MKSWMILINIVFVIISIVLIGMGGYGLAHADRDADGNYLDIDGVATGSIILLTIGILVFLLSFLGGCGVMTENKCMVLTYLILLGIIVVIQIILGISAAVHKVNQKDVDNQLKTSMIDYSNDMKFWDDMQTNLKCCGIDQAGDWVTIGNRTALPVSCCDKPENGICGQMNETFHKNGCRNLITASSHTTGVSIFLFVFSVIQIVIGIVVYLRLKKGKF